MYQRVVPHVGGKIELLDHRHKDRKRNEYDLEPVDEKAENEDHTEDEQQRSPVAKFQESQQTCHHSVPVQYTEHQRECIGGDDHQEDHRRHVAGFDQDLTQPLPVERAVDQHDHECPERAERPGLRGCCPARQDRCQHAADQTDRQHQFADDLRRSSASGRYGVGPEGLVLPMRPRDKIDAVSRNHKRSREQDARKCPRERGADQVGEEEQHDAGWQDDANRATGDDGRSSEFGPVVSLQQGRQCHQRQDTDGRSDQASRRGEDNPEHDHGNKKTARYPPQQVAQHVEEIPCQARSRQGHAHEYQGRYRGKDQVVGEQSVEPEGEGRQHMRRHLIREDGDRRKRDGDADQHKRHRIADEHQHHQRQDHESRQQLDHAPGSLGQFWM